MIPFGANGSPGTRGLAGDAQRRATALAVAVLCLLLGSRMFSVLYYGASGQLPFTVALFVCRCCTPSRAPGGSWPATA